MAAPASDMTTDISIHAPREGSDKTYQDLLDVGQDISIHAPREGSDGTQNNKQYAEAFISIHAPREGSDSQASFSVLTSTRFLSTLPARGATRVSDAGGAAGTDFYPRSPRGERPYTGHWCNPASHFYPRSPRGERRPDLNVMLC